MSNLKNEFEGEGVTPLPSKPARQNKTLRRRKAGDIAQLRTILWNLLLDVEALFQDQSEPDVKLRSIFALSTLSGVYLKATESFTLESRLTTLEKELHDLRNQNQQARGETTNSQVGRLN